MTDQSQSAIYPSLRGRHVLISGGASGIGAAIVERFVQQGARVSFLDIDAAAAEALAERCASLGPRPEFRRCDLTDLEALKQTISALQAQFGNIDVLINNAANDDRHRLDEVTPEYWDQRIAVNLRHLLFCAQAVVPGMQAAGGGVVINLGSVSWHLASPDMVIYQTAKAGIEGLTRALARDLGEQGIRVCCVVPGGVRTPRQTLLWHNDEEVHRMLTQQCLKQRVEPEDVAAMVLFLASDDARACTAHEYFVDAGWR